MTVPELARTFATAFVHDTRDDGTLFVRLAPTAPAWCHAIVRSAHQNAFPHDRLYAMIRDCAIAIDEQLAWEEDLNAIEAPEPPIYDRDLWDWAATYPDAQHYINEALEGDAPHDVLRAIQIAMAQASSEITSIILENLRRRAVDDDQCDTNAEEEETL